jgi:hypothetical protein
MANEPPIDCDPCGECGMPTPPRFHPYLHCLIWRSLHLDPDEVLTSYGYVRRQETPDVE